MAVLTLFGGPGHPDGDPRLDGVLLAEQRAPRRPVPADGEDGEQRRRRRAAAAGPAVARLPAEPPHVPLHAPRRDAPEPCDEVLERGVHRVQGVEGVFAGVGARHLETERPRRRAEARGHLARHPRPAVREPRQLAARVGGDGRGRGYQHVGAPVRPDHREQRVALAGAAPPAAARRPPGLEAGVARVVPGEALGQERLVGLDGVLGAGREHGDLPPERLARPHAHEPRGLEADPALLGALAQREAGAEAPREGRPGLRGQVGAREHPARVEREAARAAAAQPALPAPGVACPWRRGRGGRSARTRSAGSAGGRRGASARAGTRPRPP